MTTEEIRAPASHATMADVRAPQERQATLGQRIYRYRFVYLMLVPTFALLLTFNYYPAFMGLYRAFFKWDIGLQPEFLGLGNFEKLFIKDDIFLKSLRHVSLLTSWRVISAVTFPFIVAELIFNLRSNVHKYTYRVLTILPAVVPGIVILLLWQFIYDGTHGLSERVPGGGRTGGLAAAVAGQPEDGALCGYVHGVPVGRRCDCSDLSGRPARHLG